jgi:hypothetical protein
LVCGARPAARRERDPFRRQQISDPLPALVGADKALRRITVPPELGDPSPGWADAYDKQLAKSPGAHPPFTNYHSAISTVRAALSPAVKAAGHPNEALTHDRSHQDPSEGNGGSVAPATTDGFPETPGQDPGCLITPGSIAFRTVRGAEPLEWAHLSTLGPVGIGREPLAN